MAKLIVNEIVYEEYDHKYFYEKRYESVILAHLKKAFSDYFIYKFNYLINSTDYNSSNRPDIIMVRKDYKEWYIVEVEKENHPLTHVISQIDTFHTGNYDNDFKAFIRRKFSGYAIDINKFIRLINRQNPRILVIVNSYKMDWLNEFRQRGTEYIIFEIYKEGVLNGFRVDGVIPHMFSNKTKCYFESESTSFLRLANNNFITKTRGKVKISCSGRFSDWKIKRIGGNLYLQSIYSNTLRPDEEYLLGQTSNNKYILQLD